MALWSLAWLHTATVAFSTFSLQQCGKSTLRGCTARPAPSAVLTSPSTVQRGPLAKSGRLSRNDSGPLSKQSSLAASIKGRNQRSSSPLMISPANSTYLPPAATAAPLRSNTHSASLSRLGARQLAGLAIHGTGRRAPRRLSERILSRLRGHTAPHSAICVHRSSSRAMSVLVLNRACSCRQCI